MLQKNGKETKENNNGYDIASLFNQFGDTWDFNVVSPGNNNKKRIMTKLAIIYGKLKNTTENVELFFVVKKLNET